MPPFDPEIHHRRSVRIPGYDYSAEGMYFITICVDGRRCLFGDVVEDVLELNDVGRVIDATWRWLAEQYDHVELGPYIVMPNHVHGIILLTSGEGVSRNAPTISSVSETIRSPEKPRKPIGQLVGAFKTVSTKKINVLCGTPGAVLWQRNYWEHVVRNEKSFEEIARYIDNNPRTWYEDKLFSESH
jgi:putative transposase